MDLHGNAALSWSGRRELARRVVEQGWTLTAAAEAAGVSVRCARKWVGRYRAGDHGLVDRSSAPRRVANRTEPARVEVIVKLRRLRMTAAEIAETLQMPLSTVSGILTRLGIGRLGRIGLEQPVRYERRRPGELIHIDVKKLGRIRGVGHRISGSRASQAKTRVNGRRTGVAGWEFVHIAIDDYSRLAYAEVRRREGDNGGRLPPPGRRLLPSLRDQGRTAADRQRRLLPRRPARARLPPARHQTPPHQATPAADQRESRALHPHPARRLGLRTDLRLKPRTHASP